ncbi:hypothetical protein DSCO28_67130 [Desulfosarcina ovata subsp. sediminis]|uniref:Uncharacterized protein n=2 Tax=Desulfosarcina ovata TaxID=83564 RepID=A0A5K8A105_9BACT|nr:hypothetical protein DSCO28_67130 [Desulfosarcina ovata subsp. sediminis]
MEKIYRNNFLVALFYLAAMLIFGYIDVKVSRIQGGNFIQLLIILMIVYFSFLYVNRRIFKKYKPYLRILAIISLSAGITALWLFLSVSIYIEFIITIGGTI